jgi:hypothetical protein
MTEADKGAAKDYISLRIQHFQHVINGLIDFRNQFTDKVLTDHIDTALENNKTIIFELEGVAKHLKIDLWMTNDDSKNLKKEPEN